MKVHTNVKKSQHNTQVFGGAVGGYQDPWNAAFFLEKEKDDISPSTVPTPASKGGGKSLTWGKKG